LNQALQEKPSKQNSPRHSHHSGSASSSLALGHLAQLGSNGIGILMGLGSRIVLNQ